ncbi:MAG: hypothetical protein ACN6PI_20240 [Sphingobacterium siyangense]|uniref:hypothetical protein n=1 Tax=Sphingobacterium sp. UBA5996 TaxID=1947505 RepID=UPI0025FC0B92|nr:hypothetical protein [Sphingobacterium sp. UBA5996]
MKRFLFTSLSATILFASCLNSETTESTELTDTTNDEISIAAPTKLSGYTVSPPTISRTPTKTLYRADIVLKGDDGLNDENNKQLLLHLYDSIKNSDASPNAVSLFLFQTEEHSQSGMGQWVARLSKAKNDDEPTVAAQHFKIPPPENAPSYRKSLTLEIRKEIFKEIIQAEDRSMQEAERKYPLTSFSNAEKNDSYQHQLAKKFKAEIQRKFKVDQKTLKTISLEGLEYNWPMPKYSKD